MSEDIEERPTEERERDRESEEEVVAPREQQERESSEGEDVDDIGERREGGEGDWLERIDEEEGEGGDEGDVEFDMDEDESEEEEEDEEGGGGIGGFIPFFLAPHGGVVAAPEEPEDNNPINFDTSLPSIHRYLGDVDIVPAIDIGTLQHGVEITVPIFFFPNVILFPGETLPLRLRDTPQANALQSLVGNQERLFGVANTEYRSSIISLAEIRYRKQANGRGDDEILIAVGKYRMKVRTFAQHYDKVLGTGTIYEDGPTIRLPREAKKNLAFWHTPIWQKYDARLLMKQARALADFLEVGVKERADTMDPTQYSFWLARNMPFQDKVRHALLEQSTTQDRLKMEISLLRNFSGISCRYCGNAISAAVHLLNMSSDGSLGAYVNAYGHIHETLTVKRVFTQNVFMDASPPSTESSWFPGYAWTIMHCSGCGGHMGWRYDAVDDDTHPKVFWGLRRPALIVPITNH